ncbi:MAG: hypothetical protein JKY20_08660 [Alphaproteobacteria bacterium]|nr:hypothetical protein [Alphaproteobacteria bacterium]
MNRREMYALDDFFDMEGPSQLSWSLWKSWQEESRQKQILDADAFLTKHFYPLGMKGNTLVIDVSDPDPKNFIIEFIYETYAQKTGIKLIGNRVGDFPCPLHARSLMSEYLTVRETGQPLCHEIDQTMLDLSRNYRRILLPLRGQDKKISKVLVVSRLMRPVEKLPAPAPIPTPANLAPRPSATI